MKSNFRNELFYSVCLPALGLAALLLQQQAFRTAYDAKGLFVWGNPWTAAMLVLCAGYALALVLWTRRNVTDSGRYEDLFPGHWFRGGVEILAGVLLAEDILYSLTPVTPVMKFFGFAAAAALAAAGGSAIAKKRPLWIFHGLVCLYFALRLLTCYQTWGSSAHMELYAFPIVANVLLVLYAFHRTEADAGLPRRKKLLLTGSGAVLCCFLSLAGSRSLFYLLTLAWVLASLCLPGGKASENRSQN